jgi:hypothetical protein
MTEIGKTVCSICDVGKQSSLTARNTSCSICDLGRYQSEKGSTAVSLSLNTIYFFILHVLTLLLFYFFLLTVFELYSWAVYD